MADSHHGSFVQFTDIADRIIDPSTVRVALDVGSRDAEIAILMKRHYPNAVVYAFECNPAAITLCKQNIGKTTDVHLVEAAVSDFCGPVDFFSIDSEKTVTPHPDGNIGASSLFKANPDYPYEKYFQNRIVVQATTLQQWASDAGIERIDVIWMDVQGAELQALKGMGSLIRTVRAIHAEVEYKPVYLGQPLARQVRGYLASSGFVLHSKLNSSPWFGDELFVARSLWPWWKRIPHILFQLMRRFY